MKIEAMLEDVDVRKMVSKHKLFESIPLHIQKLNCGTNVYEVKDHVREKGLSSN
jgi:hypothetical protein